MTHCFFYLLVFTALVIARTVFGYNIPIALLVMWAIVTTGKCLFVSALSVQGAVAPADDDND